MDHVTLIQRERERERWKQERQALDRQSGDHKVEIAQKDHEDEIEVLSERGLLRGWGDRTTWMWVLFFVFVILGPWLACYYLTGSATQTHWHLGYPPTGPD